MDSLTSKVAQKPRESGLLILALIAVVCLLLFYVYYTKDHMSVLKYNNWQGGMNPLWQLGSCDAGMYGSMGRPCIETGMFDASQQYMPAYGQEMVHGNHLEGFEDGMTPGCGTSAQARAEAQGIGLAGAIQPSAGMPYWQDSRGYHDENSSIGAASFHNLNNHMKDF